MPDAHTDSRVIDHYVGRFRPPCPACRAEIAALDGDRCPECGETLTLRLRTAQPRQGAFIAGLIGLSLGLGFTLAWVAYGAIGVAAGVPVADVLGDGWPLLPMLALLGAASWAWIGARRRVRLQRPAVRVALAAACWGLSIVLAALFYARAMW